MEDIDIKQRVGKSDRMLRQRLYDVAFHELKEILRYQLEKYGKTLRLVNPATTSKTCARCGFVKEDLSLADRILTYSKCGLIADRDYNASLNILRSAG
jgi:putative transposase